MLPKNIGELEGLDGLKPQMATEDNYFPYIA